MPKIRLAKLRKLRAPKSNNPFDNYVTIAPKAPKAKRKPKSRATKADKSVAKQNVSKHTHAACSISDPFCDHARAAKRPDGQGGMSYPYQIRYLIPITTDANGQAFYVIGMSPVYGYGSAPAAASAVLPATWTIHSCNGFVVTNAAEVRFVSGGVVFRSTAAATASSGIASLSSIANPVISTTYSRGVLNLPSTQSMSLAPGNEMTFISRSHGGTAHEFIPLATLNTNTFSAWDWSSCLVELNGCPASTTMGYAEVVMNVEFTANITALNANAMGGVQINPKPANPIAITAQGQLNSKVPAVIKGGTEIVGKIVEREAANLISSLLDDGLAWVAALL